MTLNINKKIIIIVSATILIVIIIKIWSERIGPTAGLKTLEIMEKEKSWETITKIGIQVQKIWKEVADKHDVNIDIKGIPALSTFSFNHFNKIEFKTYLTQEFLKMGFLGSTSFYPCLAHTEEILSKYFEILDQIFFEVSNCILDKKNIKDLLKSKTAHTGFKRLN